MESVLYRNRPQYYQAIEDARKANDFGVFIEFTLSALYEIIATQERHQVEHQVDLTDTQLAVLTALEGRNLSRKEIFSAIDMNSDSRSYKRHVEPLLSRGLIEMTVPDKPNSRLQKYQLTSEGQKMKRALGKPQTL